MAKGTAAPPSKAAPGKASKAATPAKPPAAPAKSPAKGRAEPKKRAASSSSGSSSDEDRAPQRPSQPVEVEESSSSSSSASDMEEVIEPQQPPPKGKQKQQPLVADVPVVTVRIDKEVSGGDKKGKPADKAKKGGVVPAPAPAPAPAAKPAPASKPAKPAAPAAAEKEKAKPAEKSKPAAKAPVKAASESSSSSSSSSEDEAEQEHEAPAAEVEAPHAAEADAKKRRGRPPGRRSKPKRDPDAPKRPGSAYTIFVQEKHAEVKARLEAELREEEAASGQEEEGGKSKVQKAVIGELGKIWKAMTDEEKEPYKEKASVEKALYEAKSKEYTDSGAKERWAAEHPKVDAKHPAPAATAAMFATPAPHVPVSTVNPALHAKLVRFAEEDGFEGANEIQAMIAALPTEQRNEAHRRFNYLLDYKRLRTVDQLAMAIENIPAADTPRPAAVAPAAMVVEKKESSSARKVKPEVEMTDKAKHRKANQAWKRMLVRDLGFPKQPETSYLAFRTAHQKPVRDQLARNHPAGASIPMKEVAEAVATMWRALSDEEKRIWDAKAEANKRDYERRVEEWAREHPGYSLEVPAHEVDKWARVEEPAGGKRKRKSAAHEAHEEEGEHEEEHEEEGSPEPAPAPAKPDPVPAAVASGDDEEEDEEERRRRKEAKRARKEQKKLEKMRAGK